MFLRKRKEITPLEEFLEKVSCNASNFKSEDIFTRWNPNKSQLSRMWDIRISPLNVKDFPCVEVKYTNFNQRETSVIFM